MGAPKKFDQAKLFPILRKLYNRVTRTIRKDLLQNYVVITAKRGCWDHHHAKWIHDLGSVKPHVKKATIKLLDPRHNPILRHNPEQVIPVIWALGKMKVFEAGDKVFDHFFLPSASAERRRIVLEALEEMGYYPAIPRLFKFVHGSAPMSEKNLALYVMKAILEEHPEVLRSHIKDIKKLRIIQHKCEGYQAPITGLVLLLRNKLQIDIDYDILNDPKVPKKTKNEIIIGNPFEDMRKIALVSGGKELLIKLSKDPMIDARAIAVIIYLVTKPNPSHLSEAYNNDEVRKAASIIAIHKVGKQSSILDYLERWETYFKGVRPGMSDLLRKELKI
ncbi:MAG: hypothetical protein V3T21_03685 [Candidatus Margulisiibacteriota bacterium]